MQTKVKQNMKSSKKNLFLYRKYFKRPLDFLLSLIAIIILSPLLLGVAILVKVKLGGPIIFKQMRPGLNEKTFTLYKFRTMTDEKDANGELLPDENRLTQFGKFLRSTSIDELPELFNILKGDMSFVGPRPLLVNYLQFYTKSEKHRHDVKPGLTGLAQIRGRNYMSWEAKFESDLEYINKNSFKLDVYIIYMTFIKVIKRENIETASTIEHNGAKYVPLDVERMNFRGGDL